MSMLSQVQSRRIGRTESGPKACGWRAVAASSTTHCCSASSRSCTYLCTAICQSGVRLVSAHASAAATPMTGTANRINATRLFMVPDLAGEQERDVLAPDRRLWDGRFYGTAVRHIHPELFVDFLAVCRMDKERARGAAAIRPFDRVLDRSGRRSGDLVNVPVVGVSTAAAIRPDPELGVKATRSTCSTDSRSRTRRPAFPRFPARCPERLPRPARVSPAAASALARACRLPLPWGLP